MTVNVTNTVGANNTIVLDGSSKIPAFDGSLVTALSATAFTTGTLATARIDVGTTAGKILQLDGSARLPALSGANLVNAPGPTVSTSDPAIDTNPTLGAKWINKTSGEVYICTDATAGENVWTNVGAGTGDVQPWLFQGSLYGYGSGGKSLSTVYNIIERFPFASDTNSSDVGDLTVSTHYYTVGVSSATHGYAMGGEVDVIEKYQMVASADATDVGNLIAANNQGAGTHTEGWGYHVGGSPSWPVFVDTIEKISFSSDGNAVDQGNLTVTRGALCGASSLTHGYAAGGYNAPEVNVIDKHAFANSNNATDVGDLYKAGHAQAGISSATHGYAAGGMSGSPYADYEKWTFASDANSADVANLTVARYGPAGISAIAYGYAMGGGEPTTNIIEKFNFSSGADATDVGDITQVRRGIGGCQI